MSPAAGPSGGRCECEEQRCEYLVGMVSEVDVGSYVVYVAHRVAVSSVYVLVMVLAVVVAV